MPDKSGKLAPKAERYCQNRVLGMNPLDAMQAAGYKLDQNASLAVLTKKANAYDRSPHLVERMQEIRTDNSLLEADTATPINPSVFKELDLNKNEMSIAWVNAAAYTVYRQAMATDNFHQCLQTLRFIADVNGFGNVQSKPGRPRVNKTPNDNETSHNHEFDPDAPKAEDDPAFDTMFADPDGSDGEEPTPSRSSRSKTQAASRQSARPVEDADDGSDESDKWDTGIDGED